MAAGCNNTSRDGVSLHPKDPMLRKKWADEVSRTRENGSHRSILHFVASILKTLLLGLPKNVRFYEVGETKAV